ncbi:translation initiation factor IF-2 [Alsobacter sp. SYSU BS001988]
MTDTKNSGDKTLHVPGKTLSLKRPVEQGVVRQSFSHGRSKAVVVEKVKRRVIGPGEPPKTEAAPAAAAPTLAPRPAAPKPAPVAAAPAAAPPAPSPAPVSAPAPVAAAPAPAAQAAPAAKPTVSAAPAPAARPAAPAAPSPAPTGRGPAPQQGRPPQRPMSRPAGGVVLRTLTEDERDARATALVEARRREEEERKQAIIDAQLRVEREAREKIEREAAEARKREEEARHRREEEVRRKTEDEAKRRLGEEPRPAAARPAEGGAQAGAPVRRPGSPAAPTPSSPGAARRVQAEEEETKRIIRRPGMPMKIITPPKPERAKTGDEKRRGRLTVTAATGGEEERMRSVAAFRRRVQRLKGNAAAEPKEKIAREVTIPETITIQELANRMTERGVDVIRYLMKQGQLHKITDVIDADTAQLIAEEFGHTVKRVADSDVEEGLFDAPDADETLEGRPPVVTIMGHVDHGKTSLLDAIRHANVASGEAGGITQHIGAYQVVSPLGSKITFIDTPGHAAFTAMRARGAKVTDIVVLVVAADDGVMPQTIEAINHAKAAKVPMIVAINKIDKPDAKPERVRSELLQYEVQVESMGGDTLEVEVSATKKINLDKLLEAIALQSEVLDIRANPARPAEGSVIEAKLDRGRGPVATVLVQRGTLKTGDIVVAGSEWGRVRALVSDQGVQVSQAGPSVPVEILGFNGAPEAGDRVAVVDNEARAREVTEYRQHQRRERAAARAGNARGSLADMMSNLKSAAGRKEFPLVVKGDVQGSVEAIAGSLEKVGNDEVAARIIHAGAGGINESDITLAEASGAVVLGFNVRANKEAREAAERSGVEIRYYNIIYDLVDDIKQAMSGLLPPTLREERLGEARILQVFAVSKIGKVAGCLVQDGRVERGASVRLIRDNVVIHEGKLSTLKRFKDEVKEVPSGQECGMAFENYQDMRVGDVIECYRVEEVRRSL